MVIASNKGCAAVSWLGCSWRVSVLAFCGPNGWFSVCTWLRPLKGCFREYKLLLLSAVTAESWRGEMLQPAPGEALGWCWHQRASGWGRKINNVQSFCRETANTKLRNTSQRKSLPPSFGLLSGSSAFANKAGLGTRGLAVNQKLEHSHTETGLEVLGQALGMFSSQDTQISTFLLVRGQRLWCWFVQQGDGLWEPH